MKGNSFNCNALNMKNDDKRIVHIDCESTFDQRNKRSELTLQCILYSNVALTLRVVLGKNIARHAIQ